MKGLTDRKFLLIESQKEDRCGISCEIRVKRIPTEASVVCAYAHGVRSLLRTSQTRVLPRSPLASYNVIHRAAAYFPPGETFPSIRHSHERLLLFLLIVSSSQRGKASGQFIATLSLSPRHAIKLLQFFFFYIKISMTSNWYLVRWVCGDFLGCKDWTRRVGVKILNDKMYNDWHFEISKLRILK